MPSAIAAAMAAGEAPWPEAAAAGRGRKRWNNKWKTALNEFDQLFDGRLTAGRV